MTTDRRRDLIPSTRWSRDQLNGDRLESIAAFRQERLVEPIDDYGNLFDRLRGVVEDLLEETVDLTRVESQSLQIMTETASLDAFRYLAGPPISLDDLKTLVDTNTLSPTQLRKDPDLVRRLMDTVLQALDHRRFPWIVDGREPDPSEREAAIVASAALMAMRGVESKRRNEGKTSQEKLVEDELIRLGFIKVNLPNRSAATLSEAPLPGTFCGETALAGRKADFIVGLWDNRTMPIECKVSNSSVNSLKRLNNDAAAKAESWMTDLGQIPIVPTAVVSGVFSLDNLENAQNRGLTIYWAHRLSDLSDWISSTRRKEPRHG